MRRTKVLRVSKSVSDVAIRQEAGSVAGSASKQVTAGKR